MSKLRNKKQNNIDSIKIPIWSSNIHAGYGISYYRIPARMCHVVIEYLRCTFIVKLHKGCTSEWNHAMWSMCFESYFARSCINVFYDG